MSIKIVQHPIAVIDIGSTEIRLRIGQRNNSKIIFLESIAYPLNLGRDTYNHGMISYEKVHSACEIIQNFLIVCKEYGVKNIKAIATSAVREANNKDYILDQIKIKTGIEIKVIDDYIEKNYIFKMMSYFIEEEYNNSSLMAYIGSGSIGIALMDDSKIPYMQSIKIGSLRVSELFDSLYEYSSEFYLLVEEYISTFIDMLDNELPPKIDYFIASGLEAASIAQICGAEIENNFYYNVNMNAFLNLYEDIKFKSAERIAKDYQISEDKAEVLLPAMCIYKKLMQFTDADKIITPMVYLTEAVAFEMLFGEEFDQFNKDFNSNTLLSAKKLAKKFHIIENHYLRVEIFSIKIFDKMKKIHGLGRKEKLLLRTAAILHDCGKFINLKDHYRHSYNIIKGSQIVGLSNDDLDIVANIALYHSRILPNKDDDNYRDLKASKKVLVSKLSAILRLSDALDRSLKQKFEDIEVKLNDSELIVTVATDENIELEQWAFKDKGRFFEEVFGIKPVIKKRKVL